jgi:hypothetical protein
MFPLAAVALGILLGMRQVSTLVPLRFMARRIRVPADWLQAEALAGRIPHLNANGRLLFNPAAVERVLAARADDRPSRRTGGRNGQ